MSELMLAVDSRTIEELMQASARAAALFADLNDVAAEMPHGPVDETRAQALVAAASAVDLALHRVANEVALARSRAARLPAC